VLQLGGVGSYERRIDVAISSLTEDAIGAMPEIPAASMQAEPLLTVHEVAALLRVPVSWVYERTRRRGRERLPHIKMGKYLRFRAAEIHHYLGALRRD
jgi:excisionase family DNA binding protein